jgi:hypothetical protein
MYKPWKKAKNKVSTPSASHGGGGFTLTNNPKPRNLRNILPTQNSRAIVILIINSCPLIGRDIENRTFLADRTRAIISRSCGVRRRWETEADCWRFVTGKVSSEKVSIRCRLQNALDTSCVEEAGHSIDWSIFFSHNLQVLVKSKVGLPNDSRSSSVKFNDNIIYHNLPIYCEISSQCPLLYNGGNV